MRKDMFKVIVERPRVGGHDGDHHYFRAAKNFKLDEELDVADEFVATKLPMKRGRSKQLNENLGPLRRFLTRRVGYPWDVVFSEICENLKPSSTVQQHVRDHVSDYVALKVTFGDDGNIYEHGKYGVHEIWSYRRHNNSFYVHPQTGLLCKAPVKERSYYRWNDLKHNPKKEINELLYFEKFTFEPVSPLRSPTSAWVRYDLVLANPRDVYRVYNEDRTAYKESWPYEVVKINGKVYRKTSKTASKKDLRDFGLNN